MNKEQEDFANKYHFKVVKPLLNHYKDLPEKEFIVTSALYNWEDDGKTTLFAIKALDYTPENKHWFTIKIAADEFEKCIADFEIIRDGREETKPVIIDELLISWLKQEDGKWHTQFSSYVNKEGGTDIIPIEAVTRPVKEGTDEYAFIYKTVWDLGQPSKYIVTIPVFNFREEIEEYIKPFRQDVLDDKVIFGINKRILDSNLALKHEIKPE